MTTKSDEQAPNLARSYGCRTVLVACVGSDECSGPVVGAMMVAFREGDARAEPGTLKIASIRLLWAQVRFFS